MILTTYLLFVSNGEQMDNQMVRARDRGTCSDPLKRTQDQKAVLVGHYVGGMIGVSLRCMYALEMGR